MKRIAIVLIGSLLFSTQSSNSQNLVDACKTIITDGLRNYSIKIDSSSSLNTVFDRYCDSSGSSKAVSAGFGLDAAVKAIPFRLTGTFSNSEEAVRNFCRNYASSYASQANKSEYTETTVRRAYDSFDQCVALAQNGHRVMHHVENLEKVSFFLTPGNSRPIILQGLSTTNNVKCEGQDPNKAGKAIQFDINTNINIALGKVLNGFCTRTGVKNDQGTVTYDEAVITIATDIGTNANYSIFIPKDEKMADSIASEINQTLKALHKPLIWSARSTQKQIFPAMLPEQESGTGGINLSVVQFDSVVSQPGIDNAITTGPNWAFTPPVDGIYQVSVNVLLGADGGGPDAGYAPTVGFLGINLARKDAAPGQPQITLASVSRPSTPGWSPLLSGSIPIFLKQGEKIDFRVTLRQDHPIMLKPSSVSIALIRAVH